MFKFLKKERTESPGLQNFSMLPSSSTVQAKKKTTFCMLSKSYQKSVQTKRTANFIMISVKNKTKPTIQMMQQDYEVRSIEGKSIRFVECDEQDYDRIRQGFFEMGAKLGHGATSTVSKATINNEMYDSWIIDGDYKLDFPVQKEVAVKEIYGNIQQNDFENGIPHEVTVRCIIESAWNGNGRITPETYFVLIAKNSNNNITRCAIAMELAEPTTKYKITKQSENTLSNHKKLKVMLRRIKEMLTLVNSMRYGIGDFGIANTLVTEDVGVILSDFGSYKENSSSGIQNNFLHIAQQLFDYKNHKTIDIDTLTSWLQLENDAMLTSAK